jgi:hypothetical protein
LRGKLTFERSGFRFEVEFESREELEHVMRIAHGFLRLELETGTKREEAKP